MNHINISTHLFNRSRSPFWSTSLLHSLTSLAEFYFIECLFHHHIPIGLLPDRQFLHIYFIIDLVNDYFLAKFKKSLKPINFDVGKFLCPINFLWITWAIIGWAVVIIIRWLKDIVKDDKPSNFWNVLQFTQIKSLYSLCMFFFPINHIIYRDLIFYPEIQIIFSISLFFCPEYYFNKWMIILQKSQSFSDFIDTIFVYSTNQTLLNNKHPIRKLAFSLHSQILLI